MEYIIVLFFISWDTFLARLVCVLHISWEFQSHYFGNMTNVRQYTQQTQHNRWVESSVTSPQ